MVAAGGGTAVASSAPPRPYLLGITLGLVGSSGHIRVLDSHHDTAGCYSILRAVSELGFALPTRLPFFSAPFSLHRLMASRRDMARFAFLGLRAVISEKRVPPAIRHLQSRMLVRG